jgi:catechol 2,3-dioxygenase
MQAERIYDTAHLGHVEILTNKPEASLSFFTKTFGLTESGREGDSVYLRAFDDYEFHSLKLTAAKTTGVRHVAYRTASPQALQRRVKAIQALGAGIGWSDGDMAHGPAYRFHDPDGHVFELYFETRRYQPPANEQPALKNQAQRTPNRAIAPRRLDHINLLAVDVDAINRFLPEALGSRATEVIQLDDGTLGGCWFTCNNKSYDVAYTRDATNSRGRFHHVTYVVDQREHILQAADIFLEHGVHIETGPHKHAIQQTFFLYVWEPAGNRVELANSGSRLVLAPDWETVVWTEAERRKGQAWGLKTIESFHTHGTPPGVAK